MNRRRSENGSGRGRGRGGLAGRRRLLGLGAVAGVLATGLGGPVAAEELAPEVKVPYVPTPWPVVAAMLDLAQVGPRDLLIDLGSGDGRLVIEAARARGARGLGVELDADLVQISQSEARRLGVADRARFLRQDLFETDLTPATVLTLYLLPPVMMALRPRLATTLAPGTRIVSHDFMLGDWMPDRTVKIDVPEKSYGPPYSTVHLWVVPAYVHGRWEGRFGPGAAAQAYTLDLTQQFQQVSGTVTVRGRGARLQSAALAGDRLSLTAVFDGPRGRERHELSAQVRAGRIEGEWRPLPAGAGPSTVAPAASPSWPTTAVRPASASR